MKFDDNMCPQCAGTPDAFLVHETGWQVMVATEDYFKTVGEPELGELEIMEDHCGQASLRCSVCGETWESKWSEAENEV